MRSPTIILIFSLVRFCFAILPMELWGGAAIHNLEWAAKPTWYAVYSLADVFSDKQAADIDGYDVIEVAAQMYLWLETQFPDPPKRSTQNGFCLVAVVWDPVTQEFIASTIPQGPRKVSMIKLAAPQNPNITPRAPNWYRQVSSLVDLTQYRAKFHAEDGLFFYWETRAGQARVVQGRYTGPLLLGVYGKRIWTEKGIPRTEGPHIWSPCGVGEGARIPSCQTVARGLGVTNWVEQPRRRRDDDVDDDENMADVDGSTPTLNDIIAAEEVDIACGASSAKRLLHRREDDAACSSYIDPPILSAIPQPEAAIASEVDIASITASPVLQTSTTAPPTGPKPSCSLQQEDPDQGINTQYCICQSSMTLALLSVASTAEATEACDYTTLPSSPLTTVSTGFHSTTTNSALCEVCSQVVNNEDACTTIPNCLPQAAKASVTVATSPLHVGTLTGDALYTSVSNALMSVCPPVTQTTSSTKCSGTATIKGITYVEDESIARDGELEVFAAFSEYNQTSLRNAMIQSLAQGAAKSATGKNCYNASYSVLEKRDETGRLSWYDTVFRRDLAVRDRPYTVQEEIQLCNMAELALVNYYSQFWRLAPEPTATDYIAAQYRFQVTNGAFMCEFLEILADALVAIEPEFAVAEVELGEELAAVCQGLTGEN